MSPGRYFRFRFQAVPVADGGGPGPTVLLRGPVIDFYDAAGCPSSFDLGWLFLAEDSRAARAALALRFGCACQHVLFDRPGPRAPKDASAPRRRVHVLERLRSPGDLNVEPADAAAFAVRSAHGPPRRN